MLDKDGSGTIDQEEMLSYVRAAGRPDVTAADIAALFASIDVDGSGELDFEEFLNVKSALMALPPLARADAAADAQPPDDAGRADAATTIDEDAVQALPPPDDDGATPALDAEAEATTTTAATVTTTQPAPENDTDPLLEVIELPV